MTDHYQALKEHLIETSLKGLPAQNSKTLKKLIFYKFSKVNELESVTFAIPNDVIDCAQFTFDIANEIVDGIPTKQSHKINVSMKWMLFFSIHFVMHKLIQLLYKSKALISYQMFHCSRYRSWKLESY